ncbi:hypothetical protein [Pseudomonas syringae]|uniref:hypothetical protein n=1 Tax=Pseudomonas syringae TaxID=317 RepID=UPI001F40E37D|nr:hypothetical protein [Pseudomonas syringae]MCF5223123.1 hypothetical protein [Pseudomonas syringae]MCF5243024.1 hypothetical protein [Pseudomonas syringae]
MVRVFFVFFVSFGLSYISLWGTEGQVSAVFNNVNAVLFALAALFGAMSLAFFNYVEGVMKDVPKKLRLQNSQAYVKVVGALTDLKQEIIYNIFLVVVLLLVAFVAGAFGDMAFLKCVKCYDFLVWAVLSIRGACLLSIVVATLVRLAGFVTANKLRAEISMWAE